MQIIPVSEGAFTVDRTKQFVPFDLNNDKLQDRPAGSLLVEIQPFVVTTSKDIIVLDTGLGFKNAEGILQIHRNLMDHGINPNDVTKVLLSHLHKDHASGITEKKDSQPTLSFANADYYINEEEFNFGIEQGLPVYHTESFMILKNSPRLKFTGDTGSIDENISYEKTGGHSPFHQVFWIKEDNKVAFFGGDVAPQFQQMKTKFVAKYDFDGKRSMELRKRWWEEGTHKKWTFLFYHDIKCPVYNP